jgi:hypothetical protein
MMKRRLHKSLPSERLHIVLTTFAAVVAASLLFPSIASAQFTPRPIGDPATGERYHIEGAAGLWFPTADLTLSSESLGLIGSSIDFKKDLALTDSHFPELHLEVRPVQRFKIRLQYIPIYYEQTGILTREIIFNGQRYQIGLPVTSTLDWRAYRFGMEFDFVSRDRGFAGFVLDAKYTDVTATLASAIVTEFTKAEAPIPAIGGIGRYYPLPQVSITGEFTGFSLPDKLIRDTSGHYFDFNVYGTYNFTNYIGVQAGYRSLDVGYIVKGDNGAFVLKGLFFGVVARY